MILTVEIKLRLNAKRLKSALWRFSSLLDSSVQSHTPAPRPTPLGVAIAIDSGVVATPFCMQCARRFFCEDTYSLSAYSLIRSHSFNRKKREDCGEKERERERERERESVRLFQKQNVLSLKIFPV